ncbi:hypothetical protein COCC4DRAFT_33986, partial [Bipolaris maydis ATCC 48331]
NWRLIVSPPPLKKRKGIFFDGSPPSLSFFSLVSFFSFFLWLWWWDTMEEALRALYSMKYRQGRVQLDIQLFSKE